MAVATALESLDEAVDGRIDDRLHAPLPALRRIVEDERALGREAHVRLPHRCEAEGLVLLGVRLAADPKESEIEQAHRPRQDALAGQVLAVEQGGGRPAKSGQAAANASMRSNFSRSRRARHCSWYRYCLRPAESIPVAWRWPRGSGEIHTSAHAGGIASARIRSIVRESRSGAPVASRYSNPRPRPRLEIPGWEQSDRLSLATGRFPTHASAGAKQRIGATADVSPIRVPG